jgi:hypothetical protein
VGAPHVGAPPPLAIRLENVLVLTRNIPLHDLHAGPWTLQAVLSYGHNATGSRRTGSACNARTLYWRYKANDQHALRSGDLKYLKINGVEYLFDLASDVRERANLAQKPPDRLAELRASREQWNTQLLPMSEDVFSHGLSSKQQADHY